MLTALTACTDANSPVKDDGAGSKVPFDAGVEGLPETRPTRDLQVGDGDTVRMSISYVAKWVAGKKVRMLAYDGSVPGPTLKVTQGSEIVLMLENGTDLPASLHSHGVRLDHRFDGVPGMGLPPEGGDKVSVYRIRFPDPGIYWYHPHFREDYQMELGLYGSYLVAPADSGYWPPVNREVVLMLDDISIAGNVIQPFYPGHTNHALMGRFGNVMLVNGEDRFSLRVKRNETIRFFVVNASSARVYDFRYSRDMDMNIVGADNGRFEYPDSRESYLVAPSERFIYHLYFNDGLDDYDSLHMWNYTPQGISVLGSVVYDPDTVDQDFGSSVNFLPSPHAAASIDPFRASMNKLPDEEILLTGYMDMSAPLGKRAAAEHDPGSGSPMGVEWSDSVHGEAMVAMNRLSDNRNMHWIIRDVRTGKENHEINWSFKRGSQVLIRVRNDSSTAGAEPGRMPHPMPHPIHFHGQRFLVLRVNGRSPQESLVWRDSYLIGRGFTVDLLLDASNPGDWMFHCHIAEHLQSEMMGHFRVLEELEERTPFDWSLSLHLENPVDSLRIDTALAGKPPESLIGYFNREAPGPATAWVLDGFVHFENADSPALKVSAPMDPEGRFSIRPADLLGESGLPARIKVFVKPKSAVYRPLPDTLRLLWDPRGPLSWTLDLDLAGNADFMDLRRDTAVAVALEGDIEGKVNGYDPGLFLDSIHFRNTVYPEMSAVAPLAADGSFRFAAFDLVGDLDGLHSLHISLRPVSDRMVEPASMTIHVSVP